MFYENNKDKKLTLYKMSFEITYSGDIQFIKVFYSTEKTRGCKYPKKIRWF